MVQSIDPVVTREMLNAGVSVLSSYLPDEEFAAVEAVYIAMKRLEPVVEALRDQDNFSAALRKIALLPSDAGAQEIAMEALNWSVLPETKDGC